MHEVITRVVKSYSMQEICHMLTVIEVTTGVARSPDLNDMFIGVQKNHVLKYKTHPFQDRSSKI